MELRDYIKVAKAGWVTIIVSILAFGVLFGVYANSKDRIYSSNSQLYVSVIGNESPTDLLQGTNFTLRQVISYAAVAKTPVVLDAVIDELGLSETSSSLLGRIDISTPTDTSIVSITVHDTSPDDAATIANEIANKLTEVVADIEARDDGTVPVRLTQVKEASPNAAPISPNVPRDIVLGAILGAILSYGVLILRKFFDLKVRTANDIDQYGIPMVGSVVFDQGAPVHPLIIQDSPYTQRSEAFRRLRTNLQFLDVEGGAQTITVTSAIPGEGKSTTAMNLAIALADAGSRVVIVDADLRRPTVGKIMALPEEVGLTTVLIGKASIDDVTQPWAHDNLSVITCGAIPPNPSELLGSVAMTRVIDELKEKYDIVIFDTAPLVPVTDGAVLAKLTDGALLVVGAGTVNKHQVKEAIDALEKVGARILGIVANRVPVSKNKKNDQYGYYYGYTNRDFDDKKERRKGKKKHNKELQQPLVVEEIKPKVEKPKEPQVLTPEPGIEGHPWSGEPVTGAIPTVTAKTATKTKEEKSSEQQDFSSLLSPRHAVTKD